MQTTLYDWAEQAAATLDLPAGAEWVGDRDTVTWVLDLAKEVARQGAIRPAAPVATFLAGVAIGLAGANDPAALEQVGMKLTSTLAPSGDES